MAIGIPIVDDILGIVRGAQEKGLQEAQIRTELAAKLAQHDADTIAAVNATMQAEAKSEHWMQYAWRPMVGFTFCAVLINNYVLVPYLQAVGARPLPIPDLVWYAMLAILGVTAVGRSVEKITSNGNRVPAIPLPVSATLEAADRK